MDMYGLIEYYDNEEIFYNNLENRKMFRLQHMNYENSCVNLFSKISE